MTPSRWKVGQVGRQNETGQKRLAGSEWWTERQNLTGNLSSMRYRSTKIDGYLKADAQEHSEVRGWSHNKGEETWRVQNEGVIDWAGALSCCLFSKTRPNGKQHTQEGGSVFEPAEIKGRPTTLLARWWSRGPGIVSCKTIWGSQKGVLRRAVVKIQARNSRAGQARR